MKTVRLTLLVVLLLLPFSLVLAAPVAASAPGDLDTSFGIDGKVTTDFGGNDVSQSVVVQSDGRLVVGWVSYSDPGTGDFALARYNTDGSLDTTFGADGKVTTNFGINVATIWALAIYGSGPNIGKIVAVGDSTASGNVFALARYNTNGSLDTTFGTGGKVTTDFGTTGDNSPLSQGFSVAIQDDDKLVVAGAFFKFFSTGWNFALARYDSDGSLDTTFGDGGKVITDFSGGTDAATSVAIQGDGKIVAAGYSSNNFGLARYNSDGSLDNTFGTAGLVTTDFGSDDYGFSMLIQNDGRIVVAGRKVTGGVGDFALARYNSNGSLDSTFGAGGMVTTNFGNDDYGYSVSIQSDGKLVAAGYSNVGGTLDFALAQYNPDGSLDTAFGTDGKVTTDFGGSPDVGYSTVIQSSDGKIVVAGSGGVNGDFAVARYYPSASAATPVPIAGWPGLLVMALGLAALGWVVTTRRTRQRLAR